MKKFFLMVCVSCFLFVIQGCSSPRYVYCVHCDSQSVILYEPVYYVPYYTPTYSYRYYGGGYVTSGSYYSGGGSGSITYHINRNVYDGYQINNGNRGRH